MREVIRGTPLTSLPRLGRFSVIVSAFAEVVLAEKVTSFLAVDDVVERHLNSGFLDETFRRRVISKGHIRVSVVTATFSLAAIALVVLAV